MPMSPDHDDKKTCKICGASAPRFGVVDFNKHCAEDRTCRFPHSGTPVAYHRCEACSFIFTDAFDGWSSEDFAARIYNDDYVLVDPDYVESRPRGNASRIIKLFGSHRADISCLDFGGGNGTLAALLRQANFRRAESYDQYGAQHDALPSGPFNLVTCFEVFEHECYPHRLVSALEALVEEEGLIYFSTLLQPAEIDRLGTSWWYIWPRNGHVSIYSRSALNLLLLQHDLNWGSFNADLHAAWKKAPSFATRVIATQSRP